MPSTREISAHREKSAAEFSSYVTAVTKWWMELARNVLVVAALQFFARKSGSDALRSFADISALAVAAYCFATIMQYSRKEHLWIKREWLRHTVVSILLCTITGFGLWLVLELQKLIEQLSTLQVTR